MYLSSILYIVIENMKNSPTSTYNPFQIIAHTIALRKVS